MNVQIKSSSWSWINNLPRDGSHDVTDNEVKIVYKFDKQQCDDHGAPNCRSNPACLRGLVGKQRGAPAKKKAKLELPTVENDTGECLEKGREGQSVGLKNLGATCYINCFLQLWFHDVAFRNMIFKLTALLRDVPPTDTDHPKTAMMCEMQRLFALMLKSHRSVIDPRPFVDTLGISADDQQDAPEFCKLLLFHNLERLLEQRDRCESTGGGGRFFHFMRHHFYGGQQVEERTCCNCNAKSRVENVFVEMNLNITNCKTLKDCLTNYLAAEMLQNDNQVRCNSCGERCDAKRRTEITSLPNVLYIHLMRFVFDKASLGRVKSKQSISIPLKYNFGPHLAARSPHGDSDESFQLVSALLHIGNSTTSGHYIIHIRLADGSWRQFNDNLVSESNVLKSYNNQNGEAKSKFNSSDAYVLVYVRESYLRDYYQEEGAGWLPPELEQLAREDNERLEAAIARREHSRQLSLSREQETREFIDRLQRLMPVTHAMATPHAYLPTAWIRKFLSDPNSAAAEFAQSQLDAFLCPHRNLSPDAATFGQLKRVSVQAAEEMLQVSGDAVRVLTSDMICRQCVQEAFDTYIQQQQIKEDHKIISAFLSSQNLPEGDCGFVLNREALRNWRSYLCDEASPRIPANDTDTIDQSQKSNIDQSPSSDIDQSQKSNIDQSPTSDIDQSQKLDIDQSPLENTDQLPTLNVLQSQNTDSDQSKTSNMISHGTNDNKDSQLEEPTIAPPAELPVDMKPEIIAKSGDRTVGQSEGRTVDHSGDRTVGQSEGRTADQLGVISISTDQSEMSSSSSAQMLPFNRDVKCEHGMLNAETSTWIVVSTRVFNTLRAYFPDLESFPGSTLEVCCVCELRLRQASDRADQLNRDKKPFRELLKQLHRAKATTNDAYRRTAPHQLHYVFSAELLPHIKQLVDSPDHPDLNHLNLPVRPPGFLCTHGLLSMPLHGDPDNSLPESIRFHHQRDVIIVSEELFAIMTSLGIKYDSPVTWTSASGFSRTVCEECFQHILDQHNSNKYIYEAEDMFFLPKARAAAVSLAVLSQSRQNSRQKVVRGAVKIGVSSTETVWNVKQKLFTHTGGTSAADLVLYCTDFTSDNKMVRLEDAATLGEQKVAPGSHLIWEVVQPADINTGAKCKEGAADSQPDNYVETGFSGSFLLMS